MTKSGHKGSWGKSVGVVVAAELGLKDETKGWIILIEIFYKSTTVNSLERAREVGEAGAPGPWNKDTGWLQGQAGGVLLAS